MTSKLVRDNIPDIIKADNKTPATHIADQKEYHEALNSNHESVGVANDQRSLSIQKLQEETQEFIKEPNQEELADIYQVLDAIITEKGWDKQEIINTQQQKAKQRGSFSKRIILDTIEEKGGNN
ncbi:phosphoribosyl-ATP pyrophosphohydrolase [Candidatus Pacearchaeota archaeon]|jgi:hypothetical protein|nr:phosphoribosyl-ATP pyrophosphohydrolase [Candidatus Pacearchaeota archaeon]|tara:strand:- start:537 stop:908 length:372 start_codon:yes stop_codon:yes gene_type:complete